MSEQVSIDMQLFRMGQALANEQLETIRQRERAERAEADLADEKRRRTEVPERIAAAIEANLWQFRRVTGAAKGDAICRAYEDAAQIARSALLDTATEETQGAP